MKVTVIDTKTREEDKTTLQLVYREHETHPFGLILDISYVYHPVKPLKRWFTTEEQARKEFDNAHGFE